MYPGSAWAQTVAGFLSPKLEKKVGKGEMAEEEEQPCTSVAGVDGGMGNHGHLPGQLQLPARLSIVGAGWKEVQ